MAELDAETLRELRRAKTAQKLQEQAAQTQASSGMGSVARGEYIPTEPTLATGPVGPTVGTGPVGPTVGTGDRKSTRLNSSH